MNTIFFDGNLVADVETRVSKNEKKFYTFRVAAKNRRDGTNYYNVSAVGGTGEACAKFLRKGSKVVVKGELGIRVYEKDGVKTNMGDYMLNFPKTNEGFADILLKGNTNILDNIRILLSMGVADGGDLIERIKASVADESVYTKDKYYDKAKELTGKIQQLLKMLDEARAEIEEIEADPDMTQEEKDLALILPQYTLSLILSLDVILKSIPCGDTNYSDYFASTADPDYKKLYPFVDAMTEGQIAMAVSGQIHSVLVYNAVEMSDEELEAELTELEETYDPKSVYFGTDMNLLEGAVAVTSDAIREEAATGNQWFACFTGNMAGDISISSLIGVGGVALTGVSVHFLMKQYTASHSVMTAKDADSIATLQRMMKNIEFNNSNAVMKVENYAQRIDKLQGQIDAINAKYQVSTSTVVFSSLGVAVGLAMIAFSIYSIVQIVDKYNPKYTKIPSNMVDTVSTANGNRFINYTVVNSMYKDGDSTAEKPGDTNGYSGKQWNAIYYTKSFEAGKCMTSTGYFIDSAENFGKYTPVAGFGTKNCYDLNSFNDNENTETVYMAFGNSNNKKTAETSVPTVIGSMFAYGAMAISGVAGMGLGMCIMSLIKRKKEN